MSEIDGTLKKRGAGKTAGWRDRYCKANATVFQYFKPGSESPQGEILIKQISDVYVQIFDKVELNCGFDVVVPGRTYHFAASTPGEAKKWIDSLNASRQDVGVEKVSKPAEVRNEAAEIDRGRSRSSAMAGPRPVASKRSSIKSTASEPAAMSSAVSEPSRENEAGIVDRGRSRTSALASKPLRPRSRIIEAESLPAESTIYDMAAATTALASMVNESDIRSIHNQMGDIGHDRPRSSVITDAPTATPNLDEPLDTGSAVYDIASAGSATNVDTKNEAGSIDRGRARSSALDQSAVDRSSRNGNESKNQAGEVERSRIRSKAVSSITSGSGNRTSVIADFDQFEAGVGAIEKNSDSMRGRTGTISEFFNVLADHEDDNDAGINGDSGSTNSGSMNSGSVNSAGGGVHFATTTAADGSDVQVPLRRKPDAQPKRELVADNGVLLVFWAKGKKDWVKNEVFMSGFGDTVGDLRSHLGTKGLDDPNTQFFEISHIGVDRLLDEDDSILGRTIVMIDLASRFLVLFLPDEREYVLLRVAWDVTASDVCKHRRLRKQLAGIDEPALFLRENYVDQMFAPDDCPLDVLYHPADDDGIRARKATGARTKLLIKPRHIKRASVGDAVNLAPDTNPLFSDSNDSARGMLWKQGDDKLGRWQRRYFILKDGIFSYYKSQEDKGAALNEVAASALEDVEVLPEDASERKFRFQLRTNLKDRGAFNLAADNFEQMQYWSKRLKMAIIPPAKTGFLLKHGERTGSKWKSRWFELRGSDLLYFDEVDANDGESYSARQQKGTICLADATDIDKSIDDEVQFSITVISNAKKYHRVFELKAKSSAEMDAWVSTLMKARRLGLATQDIFSNEPEYSPFIEEPSYDSRNYAEPIMVSRTGSQEAVNSPLPALSDQPREEPAPLPEPIFPLEEGKKESEGFVFIESNEPNPYADEDWNAKSEPIKIADPLLEVIQSPSDPLNKMMGLSRIYKESDRLTELATRNVSDDEHGAGAAVVNQDVPASLLESLSAAAGSAGADAPEPELDDVLVIESPAMLITVVIEPGKHGSNVPGRQNQIEMSGCELTRKPNGDWVLKKESGFHKPIPDGPSNQDQIFDIPGDITAIYRTESRRWNVTGPAPRDNKADLARDHPDPRVQLWLNRGGHAPIQRVQGAMERLLTIYNEPLMKAKAAAAQRGGLVGNGQGDQMAITRARRLLLDDSRSETVGVMVRKDFCSAVANILQHGMHPTYWGGFYTTTLWTIIGAACPRPTSSSTPSGLAAYRVFKDLDSNPNMANDPNIKFRTFICASLNHHFLRDWMADLYVNLNLKIKFYAGGSFLRTCPPELFSEVLMAIEPLMVMPFRLYSSFELRRQSTARGLRDKNHAQRLVRQQMMPPPRIRSASGHFDESEKPKAGISGPRQAVTDLPAGIAVAKYDNLEPDSVEELPFRQHDQLEILAYENDEWLVCRSENGEGLVPMNYVNII